MKDYVLEVAANASVQVQVSGAFIRVKSSTGALTFATRGARLSLSKGDRVRLPPFQAGELTVENTTGASITATVTIGDGDAAGDAVVGDVNVSIGGTFTSTPDVSIGAAAAAVVRAAATTRRYIIVSNPATNAREFRVGDAAVAAGEGLALHPGETLSLRTTAEVRAYNPHSAAQSIAVAEVLD